MANSDPQVHFRFGKCLREADATPACVLGYNTDLSQAYANLRVKFPVQICNIWSCRPGRGGSLSAHPYFPVLSKIICFYGSHGFWNCILCWILSCCLVLINCITAFYLWFSYRFVCLKWKGKIHKCLEYRIKQPFHIPYKGHDAKGLEPLCVNLVWTHRHGDWNINCDWSIKSIGVYTLTHLNETLHTQRLGARSTKNFACVSPTKKSGDRCPYSRSFGQLHKMKIVVGAIFIPRSFPFDIYLLS